MGRSRKLVLTDWTSANNALNQYFEGNKTKLKAHARMSRTTVTDFFKERPISESSFRKICLALRLNWQEISVVSASSKPSDDRPLCSRTDNEVSIKMIRETCRQKVIERHSKMRLLNGAEIRVNQLYVDVWLLGKPERRHFTTPESLLTGFDVEKDRLSLGKRIQRNSGFEVAKSQPRLIILGKPGAGKTTFLKHLAVSWYDGKFQAEKVAVLLESRKICGQSWNLIDAIGQELTLKEKEVLSLLEQGQLVLMLDGLDEISTSELRRTVQKQVKEVSSKYFDGNRFILTCRTQIMSVFPSGFTLVEVADFSIEQVKKFVQNWFMTNGQSEFEAIKQWEMVQLSITGQPDLREVMVTPVLLNLICLVLQDSGEIPTNKNRLYKKGIHLLLGRWNSEKEIESWEFGTKSYRQLSTERKERLLIEIAARKFENPQNFVLFDQDELIRLIVRYLHLTNEQEGLSILKAIESQHGLLVERADELWSFSHLTFQEYFTVQWLTQLPFQQLANRIESKKWKNTVEQIIKSQQPADRLLRLIKQAVDRLLAEEAVIQDFFAWLLRKSSSLQYDYNPASVRAFYYSITCADASGLERSLDHSLDRSLSRDISDVLDSTRARMLNRSIGFDDSIRCPDLVLDLLLSRPLAYALSLDCKNELPHYCCFSKLNRSLDFALHFSHNSIPPLEQLRNELRNSICEKTTQGWWSCHGKQWTENLRQVLIEYRDIGHNWQFNEKQQHQLQRYYQSNTFLVNLTKIEGAVSEVCRIEIQEGLLISWSQLLHLQPHLYEEIINT